MKRFVRKPLFWVALIVVSFVLNLLVAAITLHRHLKYQQSTSESSAFQSPATSGRPSSTSFFGRSSLLNAPPPHPTAVDGGLPATPDERVLWRRMLQQQSSTSVDCGRHTQTTPTGGGSVNRTVAGLDARPQGLQPFGFRQRVQEFVAASSEGGATHHGKTLRGGTFWNSVDSPHCHLPPATACHETKYSVVIVASNSTAPTSSTNHNNASSLQWQRQLVLTILSFKSYPSAGDISLILPSASHIYQLELDAKEPSNRYARRIWQWHTRGHLYLVVPQSSSVTATTTAETTIATTKGFRWLLSCLQALRPQESAVLWIHASSDNGDHQQPIKDWTGTSLLASFQIWRQQPQSLVAFSSLSLSSVEENRRSSSCPIPGSPLLPMPRGRNFRLPLHGTMMHRNLLCFLQHPVVQPLDAYLQQEVDSSTSWEVLFWALSMLWNQLGAGHLIVLGSQPPASPNNSRTNADRMNSTTLSSHMPPSTNSSSSTAAATSRRTILEYFGCSCATNTIVETVLGNSTCPQDPSASQEVGAGGDEADRSSAAAPWWSLTRTFQR